MGFSELDVIREIIRLVPKDPQGLLDIGKDDSFARQMEKGIYVFNSDMLTQSSDMLPGMSLRNFSRKCVVANFSDLASKGAEPVLFMCSLGIPNDASLSKCRELLEGIVEGTSEYSTYLVGGDISRAEEYVVDGFSVGLVRGKLIPRSGAKEGDVIYSTGLFGLTWLGYQILLKGLDAPRDLREKALELLYRPRAHVKAGVLISKEKLATSSTDSSDGLYRALLNISEASKVSAIVENLPIDPDVEAFLPEIGVESVEPAFYGGEEYCLVFTAPRDKAKTIEELFYDLKIPLYRIGRIGQGKGVFLRREDETLLELPPGGWVHTFQA